MRHCLLALAALLCGHALAQAGDATSSTDCRSALESLQAQESAVLAARQASSPARASGRAATEARLQVSRREAARACLGQRGDTVPTPQRQVLAPIVVPPVVLPALAGVRPPLPMPSPAPLGAGSPSVSRPAMVTGCDSVGCWASDGSRLLRVGPDLRGPRGICTLQGTLLNCP
jgi:hypothetical protein